VAPVSRTATRDYTLRGQHIAEGDTRALSHAAAHFDAAVFEDPPSVRVTRKPNRHLAFGTGPHQCLGLLLARLEMRIFFAQLIPRLEHIEAAGEPQHLRASFVHGLKHLPVRVKLKAR
jgi:cytochrome P450